MTVQSGKDDMQGTRILIVGAGLAGLALARALRQAGFASEVIGVGLTWLP
jgi:cation diffusion facilitator CzcD-associated flavoprotein CzcO